MRPRPKPTSRLGTSPRRPSTPGRCGPETAKRWCSAGSASGRSGSRASPSSGSRASTAAAQKRPRCTCMWAAPTRGSSGLTTARQPGENALWVASWRSAGDEWTGVFRSRLVPEAEEAQLRTIARYDPPGGTSSDEFLQHMLRTGDFVWELRNHRLEPLLRAP